MDILDASVHDSPAGFLALVDADNLYSEAGSSGHGWGGSFYSGTVGRNSSDLGSDRRLAASEGWGLVSVCSSEFAE